MKEFVGRGSDINRHIVMYMYGVMSSSNWKHSCYLYKHNKPVYIKDILHIVWLKTIYCTAAVHRTSVVSNIASCVLQ